MKNILSAQGLIPLKAGLIFLSFSFSLFSFSQNLVPNPSFEVYDTCPNNVTNFPPYTLPCKPWYQASPTPDYYNSCDSVGYVDVPNNWMGFQNALTGLAYVGFGVLDDTIVTPNQRECIGVKLTDSLKAGRKYCVSFYVSLSDSCNYSTDDFGAYFSKNIITNTNGQVLPYTPQISNSSGLFLNDKISWTLISGEFIAQGGEQYLTIGNFIDDNNTDTLFIGNGGADWGRIIYYYLDEVLVKLCDSSDGISENNTTIDNLKTFFNSNGLNVFLKNDFFYQLNLFNLLGEKVFGISNTYKNSITIDTSSFSPGIYFINIQGEGLIYSQKLFINN